MSAPTTIDDWADRYAHLHAGANCSGSAWIGVPVLVASFLGLLWSIPVPDILRQQPSVINWASLLLMATFVYYCMLSLRLALAGLLFLAAALAPSVWLELRELRVWPIALGTFVPALAWQLLVTRRATGQLRMLRNLQYLMLGPLWLLRTVFRRAGLKY